MKSLIVLFIFSAIGASSVVNAQAPTGAPTPVTLPQPSTNPPVMARVTPTPVVSSPTPTTPYYPHYPTAPYYPTTGGCGCAPVSFPSYTSCAPVASCHSHHLFGHLHHRGHLLHGRPRGCGGCR